MATSVLHLREGNAAVRDRLTTTLFLAALLHGLLLVGLTFDAARDARLDAPGMKVLIVAEDVPEADRNDNAQYLAQRTQLGSGSGSDGRAPSPQASEPAPQPGTESLDSDDEAVLAASAESTRLVYVGERNEPAAQPQVTAQSQPIAATDPTRVPTDEEAGLEGDVREELWVTPDTRESLVAPYLDAWRRKIERLGTLNYPAAARDSGGASPVVEVAIAADGQLETAVIRRTSGSPELDVAAIAILRLASPYEAFPPELATHYRALRFAYAWHFEGTRAREGSVTAPADSR